MHHLKYFLFVFFLSPFHLAVAQQSSAIKPLLPPQKFLCLKLIGKEALLATNKDDKYFLDQLQRFISKNNPDADTARTEFRQLILGFRDQALKNQYSLSSKEYNSAIDNYNNICQILDFLNGQNLPASFLKISEDFYLQQIRKNEKKIRLNDVFYSFHKNYNRYKLVKTGVQPIKNNDAAMFTIHNQLEKILTQFNPRFSLLSFNKQFKYLKQVQFINPWIESFKKGLTYNAAIETFIIDDDLLLLIPE